MFPKAGDDCKQEADVRFNTMYCDDVSEQVDVAGVDLFEHMLVIDAETRFSAEQCLAHAFFSDLADPDDEPTSPQFVDQHFNAKKSVQEWKGKQTRELFLKLKVFCVK